MVLAILSLQERGALERALQPRAHLVARDFSVHNEVGVAAEDAEGRKKLAAYMLRAPMSGVFEPCAGRAREEDIALNWRRAALTRGGAGE